MLGIIDADSFMYYAVYQDLSYEGMRQYLDDNITRVVNAAKVDKYLTVLTTDSFRYKLSKSRKYKGNRKNVVKKPEFFALREYMIQKYKAICVKNMEADDLVILLQENLTQDSIVLSPDKDVLRQSRHAFDYNAKSMSEIKNSEKQIIFNIYHQILTGDSTDNIEGVQGVGEKGADKLLENVKDIPSKVLSVFTNKYGIQDGMFRFVEAYRLIYLLRNEEDLKREVGIEIPYNKYIESNLNIIEELEDQNKDLW